MQEVQQLIQDLERRIKGLEIEIATLKADNALLVQENINLKDKLGLNSKTSSIPSSKELYKLKKESKTSTGRKI
jgi:transposase